MKTDMQSIVDFIFKVLPNFTLRKNRQSASGDMTQGKEKGNLAPALEIRNTNKNKKMIEELLNKPVWQMTGYELVTLLNSSREEIGVVNTQQKAPQKPEKAIKHYEYGIRGIAKIFGCSIPTANRIKKSGKINPAIMQVGRKIIVDADLALQLVNRKSVKTINNI